MKKVVLSTVISLISALFFFSDAILADDYKDGDIIITRMTPETAKADRVSMVEITEMTLEVVGDIAHNENYDMSHYNPMVHFTTCPSFAKADRVSVVEITEMTREVAGDIAHKENYDMSHYNPMVHFTTCPFFRFNFELAVDIVVHDNAEMQAWVQVSDEGHVAVGGLSLVPRGARIIFTQIDIISAKKYVCDRFDVSYPLDEVHAPKFEKIIVMTPEVVERIADGGVYKYHYPSEDNGGRELFEFTLAETIRIDGNKTFVKLWLGNHQSKWMSLAPKDDVLVPKGATIQFLQSPSDLK
jgi:hypothetical protein